MTEKSRSRLIIVLSIAIPIAVALLFMVKIDGYDFTFLPAVYASTNALTAALLLTALYSIKKKNMHLHQLLMKVCIGLSALFLVLYVLYHITSDPVPYGGEGAIKYVYYFLLISHIVLSVTVVPLVLFTYSRALSKNFAKHKALAKWTFPLWLYESVTGAIIYLMIKPYY